ALGIAAGLIPVGDGAPTPTPKPIIKRPSARDLEAERQAGIDWSRQLFDAAAPAAGSPLEMFYLPGRGITISAPSSIRYAANLRHKESGQLLPVMVAAVQNLDGQIVGAHRTFLTGDCRKKTPFTNAKKMSGECWGGAVRFAAAAEAMAIGEGIET